MLPTGGLGVPGITQPSSNLNPLQDVDVVTRRDAETPLLPAPKGADTGNQARNDTSPQNAFVKDTSPVSTGASNTNASPPADAGSRGASPSESSFTAFVDEARSEVARTVVEFKLSEAPPEQRAQDERTASLEAERGYQSQPFLDTSTDGNRKSDLKDQAAQTQLIDASPNNRAEQVAVAPLAPDL